MTAHSTSFAAQPGNTESHWQPQPANGFVEVHVSRHRTATRTTFESGLQEIAPGGHVREHAHDPPTTPHDRLSNFPWTGHQATSTAADRLG